MMRRWWKKLVLAVMIAVLGNGVGGQVAVFGQAPPQRSVFFLLTMDRRYQAVSGGTAFFFSSDGRALTGSHVVYRARIDRAYRLLAIVGKEFYGASIICASDLPYDPTQPHQAVPLSRDVAWIQLVPSDFPFDELVHHSTRSYIFAHRGPLPAFPALALAPNPQINDSVRVLGYGTRTDQVIPYEWSATGTVTSVGTFHDGTPGFRITFATRPAVPGHSGSPVLNMADQVVGLWDWNDDDPQKGVAISSTGLECQ